jgi:hypothetical protein
MSNRKHFFTPGARGIYLWAATLALLAITVLSFRWWHPYCDTQADGPGYYARGFPLPYEAPTGVSSGEFTWMPHVLALNLAIVGLVAFALLRLFFRRDTPGPRARIASIVGVVLFVLLAAFNGILLSSLGRVERTSSLSSDSYWSYRPSALALRTGHRACDM